MDRLQGCTLIVAEDDESLREALAEEFEFHGSIVLQAANGAEAFNLLKDNDVDGVVSDIRMPGGDGVELLRRMRDEMEAPPLLLFITGHSQLGLDDAYDMGAEAVLKKPFSVDALLEKVAWMLTPKADRWQEDEASSEQPRGSVEGHFEGLEAAGRDGALTLGKGGVFVRDRVQAARGTLVTLDFHFDAGTPDAIKGSGLVQWVRRQALPGKPTGSGIEFRTVEKQSLTPLLEAEEKLQPKSYIPKS